MTFLLIWLTVGFIGLIWVSLVVDTNIGLDDIPDVDHRPNT